MNVQMTMILPLVLLYASADNRLMVKMTLVRDADTVGAVCLDGSLPAYHLHRGSGDGANNWLLQFEGGGWCNDLKSCSERAQSRRGSSRYMNKYAVFSGILSGNRSLNPDFYNWNRVKLRYCDGASFSGDATYINGTSQLFFRGARIWLAVIRDLLSKGLNKVHMALLSGCSAGGLSSFLHCKNFSKLLPPNATLKCLSDAGFFLDVKDISGIFSMRSFYQNLISYQGVERNLDTNCTNMTSSPIWCFFPQYILSYITTPFFILNTAYDVFQFHHGLVPPNADKDGMWFHCERDPARCDSKQISVLKGFRKEMLRALKIVNESSLGGIFVNSCFAHCQSESQDTWLAPDSPRLNNKTIAEVVGDWYFERREAKEVDCPYDCASKCHNLIPSSSSA